MSDTPAAKWIDLNDATGARLKLASIDVGGQPVRHIFITNLSWKNPKWREAVRKLGFREPASRRYLVRRVADGERLSLNFFRQVFPGVRMVLMSPQDYILGYVRASSDQEARAPQIDLRGVRRLGRNPDGHNVYESLSGRFLVHEATGQRVDEAGGGDHEAFLRLAPIGSELPQGQALEAALARLARSLVQQMRHGEPVHEEHVRAFIEALWGSEPAEDVEALRRYESVFRALDEALLLELRQNNDTPALAYGEAARLHAFAPAYAGRARGVGAMPLPLAIVAQRLLGDTAGKTVVLPNAWDGALAAFLDKTCDVRAYQAQAAQHVRLTLADVSLRQEGFSPAVCATADALLFNADPEVDELGQRQDYRLALLSLRQMPHGARAVLVLAADDEAHPGEIRGAQSAAFYRQIAQRYVIDDVFETAPILARKNGGTRGLRVVTLRTLPPEAEQLRQQEERMVSGKPLAVLASWDEIKAHVDERIEAINLAEARSRQQRSEREEEGDYQRPYLAFSRLGEARTMVPANLVAPTQKYLTELEKNYGSVDALVSSELGMGMGTLAARFSPEQIDGIAIMLSRLLIGRSSILADDTGIGKGRQLAALAVWANKRGEDVYFVTDRANLFSDLARDLNDIGEWGRFAPLVFNSDGEITVDVGPGEPPRVLAKGDPALLRRVIENNASLRDVGRNICFLTYSQISSEESEKALWLKNQVSSGLVIFDEAHIAAGSDSNIARHVLEIAAAAKSVQFASATWAKTPDNLHIYQRAFPTSVSVATLAETMRKGGESFSEIFSSMLAAEGALIRREHDLSRLEVELVIDEANLARNEYVSDKIADVLGSAAYLAGEMEQVFIRTNAESVRRLREAREARNEVLPRRVKLFSSNFGTGSVIYQIMKGVQGALNAEHVARLAVQSLRQGLKPVIVSDATGESLVEKLMERQATQSGAAQAQEGIAIKMPTLRDLLREILLRRLTTVRVRDVELPPEQDDRLPGQSEDDAPAEQGHADAVEDDAVEVDAAWQRAHASHEDAAEDSAVAAAVVRARYREVSIFDASVMSDELKAVYERGIAEIETKIEAVPDLPVNAMDVIEQALRDEGFRIGEITGRKFQLVRADDGSWLMQPRITNKRAVKATIKSFNDGHLDAILINRSAAAGVSLHASPRFGDRSRRHLIEHMIPEDPVNRVQLLGRVNRFDQLSSPLITTASTGIFGEVRYLMMQNRKLARLSANVRSSRDNAMSLKGVVDLFNPVGAKAIRSYLQDSPLVARRLGFEQSDIEKLPDIVNRVTMRIPLLTVAQQRQVYDEIYSRFEEIIVRAEMEGGNPLKPEELNVHARQVSADVFVGDDGGEDQDGLSAFDAPVFASRLEWEETLSPLSWESVKAAALAAREQLLESELVDCPQERKKREEAQEALRVNADAEEFMLEALPAERQRQAPQEAAPQREAAAGEQHDELQLHDVLQLAQMPGTLLATDLWDRLNQRQNTARATVEMPVMAPDIAQAVKQAYKGLLRLALMGAQTEDVAHAAQTLPAVRRALIVSHWMEKNLDRLVPGAGFHWLSSDANDIRPEYIITNVEIPEKESWANPGKWKITVVSPGFERAREFTLRSILSEVDGHIFRGEITGEPTVALLGPMINDGIYGARAARMASMFDFAPQGKRRRQATMLTGNLYLASEWAAATGKGRSVIYTDESGVRHRGILLPREMENIRPEFLPVRVADAAAQARLMRRIMSAEFDRDDERLRVVNGHFVHELDLTFKSAMHRVRATSAATAQQPDAVMVLVPGKGIGLSMPAQDLRRVSAALRTAQKSMVKKRHLDEAHDQAHVKIEHHTRLDRTGRVPHEFVAAMRGIRFEASVQGLDFGGEEQKKKKSAGLLLLRATDEAQVQRAIELLSQFAGLEIYAARQPYRELAQDVIREVMRERRLELRRAQERARQDAAAGFGQQQTLHDEAAQREQSAHRGQPAAAQDGALARSGEEEVASSSFGDTIA